MAPWMLDELKECRNYVQRFSILPEESVEDLFVEIGGVPRYVLEMPTLVLEVSPGNLDKAKKEAYSRVQKAIDNIKDPRKTMQHFEQARDSLEFSSRLLHRWPTSDDHSEFRLEWASTHIKDEVAEVIHDDAWKEILNKLIDDDIGTARGPMFELYVRKTLRKGGLTFLTEDLDTRVTSQFEFPENPTVVRFKEIPDAPAENTLCIPKSSNFACVDLLLSRKSLFQVTVSRDHKIKGPPFQHLVNSLVEKNWVANPEELELFFIVPKDNSSNYPKQGFLSAAGTIYKRLPPLMRNSVAPTLELRNVKPDFMDAKDDLESTQADLDSALSNLEEKELELKNSELALANSEHARQVIKAELNEEVFAHAETKPKLQNIKNELVNSERAR
ncbi:hypothetical protein BGZ76_003185 [Entomortierella beljakovae]|nr:hypothetical protein BGZ76_003185 [Entomortierella beljakovae]